MKNQLLLLAALVALNLPASVVAQDNPDAVIQFTGQPHLRLGMDRETVRFMIGEPSAQLSAEVWVYFDFQPAQATATQPGNSGMAKKQNTLIVAFNDGRVSVLRACDSAPVRALLATQSQRKPSTTTIAAK